MKKGLTDYQKDFLDKLYNRKIFKSLPFLDKICGILIDVNCFSESNKNTN